MDYKKRDGNVLNGKEEVFAICTEWIRVSVCVDERNEIRQRFEHECG